MQNFIHLLCNDLVNTANDAQNGRFIEFVGVARVNVKQHRCKAG